MASRRNKKSSEQNEHGPSAQLVCWALAILIAVVTFLVFSPVLQNGFVNWDDDRNFVENPYYRGLGWTELRWMFTTFHGGHYQPLSWMTLGLDYLLWGMEPRGYHLTNVLVHAANAVLFWFVSLRLLSLAVFRIPVSEGLGLHLAAGLAALIFSIHPLRVESVAWASARRDVLSAFFFLLTVLCYLRASAVAETAPAQRRWMTAAVFVYAVSLLSKAIGMTLPAVLLLLDVYPLRRLGGGPGKWFGPGVRRVWFEKVPFLFLAIFFGILAVLIQARDASLSSLEQYGLASRLAQGLSGVVFYLWKTLIPLNLSPLYELPAEVSPLDWSYVLSGLVVLGISSALLAMRESWPAGLAVWVYYLVVLAPVSGIAQTGVQMTADRYSYLACLGWTVLAGAGLLHCWRAWVGDRIGHQAFIFFKTLVIAIVIGLGLLSWKQAQVWHDSEKLWRHVLAVGPKSIVAHNSLGVVLAGRGELKEAVEHYHQALQIEPAYAKAHNNLGSALAMRGEIETAVEHYRRALEIEPAYVKAHASLANVLARQGKLDEAAEHYRRALRIQPEFAAAHEALGRLLIQQGKRDEAVQHLEEALRLFKSRSKASNS
jgi:tetratricopeptide (TPR) repeat protein